jgi:Transglycosylase SLT domain
MRRTTALCLLALSAMAAPPAAAEQQPAEQKPTEQRAARQPATEQQAAREQAANERAAIEMLIVEHAKTHGLPAALVRLVIRRESNFNPRAAYRGNYGLMQIRLGTATGSGLSRDRGRLARSGDQHDLRGVLPGRRLSGCARRRGADAGPLFARLSRCPLRRGSPRRRSRGRPAGRA